MKKLLLICGVSLLSLGCSVGPDFEKPMVFNNDAILENIASTGENTKKISPYWYKYFGDEQLNNLVLLALKNSPDIKSAKEKLLQARYQLGIARAGFLPDFDASGQYNKETPYLPLEDDFYQVGADVSWEIDIWGGQRRLNESAKALLKSVGAEYENVKLVLISEVASQYINWKLSEKLVSVAYENLQSQKQIFDLVNNKYKAGLADDLALEQAKSVLENTQMMLPGLRENEKTYQNALAVLIGDLPSAVVKNETNLLNNKFEVDEKSLYALSADVVRNRPDVKMAEFQLASANALIGNAIAKMFPSLSLKSFLGYQNTTLSPIFGNDYNMYSFNAAVNMPILHWGKIWNNVKIQESKTKQAYEIYRSALVTAVSDISNAIKAIEEENIKNNTAFKRMGSNKKILELSLDKYYAGLIDFSDVMTAQQNRLEAEQDYLQSLAQLCLNVVRFYKSVGGGAS